jgi:hypothetical protein
MTFETCPDNHHCLNGSKCVPNPYDEGAYYCDCDEVVFESRYEGLYCEHKAEVYCISDGSSSKHSFCTNGGECIDFVGSNELHKGCKCPGDYEGSFCQFVKGSKPEGWPFTNSMTETNDKSTRVSGTSAGDIVGIFVLVVSVVVVVGAVIYRRKTKVRKSYTLSSMNSMELESEGINMQKDNNEQRNYNDISEQRIV